MRSNWFYRKIPDAIGALLPKIPLLILLAWIAPLSSSWAQSVSATYNEGNIPSQRTSYDDSCNGAETPLSVNVPIGAEVTGIDVSYTITTQNSAWLTEQRSRLRCQETGLVEAGPTSGYYTCFDAGSGADECGNYVGTSTYTRSNLNIANGVVTSGTLTFELEFFRTWGSGGCGTNRSFVPNGTWTITVYYGQEIPGTDCANAIEVSTGDHVAPAIGVSNEASNLCYNDASAGLWYTYTPNEDGLITLQSCGGVDTRVSVFTGDCNNLTCLAQNDDDGNLDCHPFGYASSIVNLAVMANETYYIQWDDAWDSSGFDWSLEFNQACAEKSITVEINFDDYPEETTWELRDLDNNLIASGGPYSEIGGTFSANYCVDEGCYTFTIFDAFSDGICCDYGNGSYSISDGDNNVLASGGSFGASESSSICVEDPVVPGCTNPDAGNYDPLANEDDGSCSFMYYSVSSGNANDAIWNTDPNANLGQMATFGPNSSFEVRNGQTVSVSEAFTANDLFITSSGGSASLSFTNPVTISLYGDITQTGGSILPGQGKILFNSNSTQSIEVIDELYQVQCNNAAGVQLSSDLGLLNQLKIDQGDFNTNGHALILRSNQAGTGSIGEIPNGSSFIGEVTLERYIPTGFQNWVNLGNGILNKTLADWNNYLVTTGFPGSDFPDYNFVNVKRYDESVQGGLNDGFTDPVGIDDALDDTRGYLVFMTGVSQHLSITGTIQQGSKSVPLNHTSTGTSANDGWELVSNIYPSEIDFEDLYAASSGISSTCYIYDAENASYKSYTAGIGVGNGTGLIPSGQSFWVQSIQPGAVLQWEESQKSNTGEDFERELADGLRMVSVGIESESFQQPAYLVFEDGMTQAYDAGSDAFHLGSMNANAPEIAWRASGEELLRVSRIPHSATDVEAYLYLNIKVAGTYNVTVDETLNLPEFACMYFEDLENGDVYSLAAGEVIPLTFEEPFAGDRFVLHVSAPVEVNTFSPQCFDSNDGGLEVTVMNGSFNLSITNEDGSTSSLDSVTENGTIGNLPGGSYTVTATDNNGLCQALIFEVDIEAPDAPVVDYLADLAHCNESAGGSIEVLTSGAGSFNLQLFDEDDTPVATAYFDEGSWSSSGLDPGVYYALVDNQCATETFEIDLRDPNAILAFAEFETLIGLENGLATIEATAACINADEWVWFINGNEVAQGGDLSYNIVQEGVYIVELFASNDFCSDSYLFEVNVEPVTFIAQEEGEKEVRIGQSQGLLMVWLPSNAGSYHLALYNTAGQLVQEKTSQAGSSSRVDFSTAELSSGNYILKVADEGYSERWNVFVQR